MLRNLLPIDTINRSTICATEDDPPGDKERFEQGYRVRHVIGGDPSVLFLSRFSGQEDIP
jgi:hypothetical protein